MCSGNFSNTQCNQPSKLHSYGINWKPQYQTQAASDEKKISTIIPTFDIQQQQQPALGHPLDVPNTGVADAMYKHEEGEFINELIKFPSLSTHSFSYNPLSPNSLFVRLIVLKRTLEVMIHNPSLIKEPSGSTLNLKMLNQVQKDSHIDMSQSKSSNDIRDYKFNKPSMNNSKVGQHGPLSAHKRNASSAVLTAYVQDPIYTSSSNSNDSRSARSSIANSTSINNLASILTYNHTEDLQDMDFIPPVAPFLKRNHSSNFSFNGSNNNLTSNFFSGDGELSEVPDLGINGYEGDKSEDEDVASTFSNDSDSNHSFIYTRPPLVNNNSSFYKNPEFQDSTEFLRAKTHEMQDLLDLLNETLANNIAELPTCDNEKQVSNLHMMSVFNISKLLLNSSNRTQDNERTETMRRNLIDSLSLPFYELYERNQEDYSQRILHDFTSGKNSSPQAIFLCENENPWSFKSVNDIACLMFGVSRNSLRALTLLDLIHKDSRNFVLNKLVITEMERDDLVFTGEIIGINDPSQNEPVWTSVWAKRRKGLIHLLFQKVPCDFMQCSVLLPDLVLKSIQMENFLMLRSESAGGRGEAVRSSSTNSTKEFKMLKEMSPSLSKLMEEIQAFEYADPETTNEEIIRSINSMRYFTLNAHGCNVPCAVTAGFAFKADIKLSIHSLPYIAGAFIIDTSSPEYSLISFNKSVSKNMFGIHAHALTKKPINTIIPNFNVIIEHMHRYYPEYNINKANNKSLVLTEHFFRKMNTEIAVVNSQISHEEFNSKFYNSTGIDGLHRDGSIIKLDLQLRVINSKYSLIWITHSRDIVSKAYNIMPSQIKILQDNEKLLEHHDNEDSCESLIVDDVDYDSKIKDKLDEAAKRVDISGGSSNSTLSVFSRNASSNSLRKSVVTTSKTADDKEKQSILDEISDYQERDISNEDESLSSDIAKQKLEEDMCADIAKQYKQNKESFLQHSNFKIDQKYIVNATSRPCSANALATISKVPEVNGHVDTYANLYNDGTDVFKLGGLKHRKKFTDFTILESMGRGAYGLVDLCMHKKLKYIVVVKRIIKERILFDTWIRDIELGTVPSEIHIMSFLNKNPHENIMFLLDFFEDDDYYYIETPIHGDTGSIDLFDLIEVKTDLKEIEVKLLFKQVVSGMKHLHDEGIVHRDIKDENIIVDGKGRVKIIDFGSATHVSKGPFDTFVGTIDYAAPEVLTGDTYVGKPQDCWSLGILLYTIVFKENPFYNIDEIMDAELKFPTTTNVSQECIKLIEVILNKKVEERPTIGEIFNDPWLAL